MRQEGNQPTGRKRSGTLNSLRSRAGNVFTSNKKKREQEAAMVPPLPTTRAESPPVPVDQ